MPNRTIYLTKENLEIAEGSLEGVGPFVNRLIRESESRPTTKSESRKKGTVIRKYPVQEYPEETFEEWSNRVDRVTGSKFAKDFMMNPNACKSCGHIKVAGKCINPKCSRKGKL